MTKEIIRLGDLKKDFPSLFEKPYQARFPTPDPYKLRALQPSAR